MTVSFGQTGSQDTVRCYGVKELQHIAAGLVKGKTCCDTLLPSANKKLALKDSVISEKNVQLDLLDKQLILKEEIIKDKKATIESLNGKIEGLESDKKWLKFGWASSTVLLGVGLFYFIIH